MCFCGSWNPCHAQNAKSLMVLILSMRNVCDLIRACMYMYVHISLILFFFLIYSTRNKKKSTKKKSYTCTNFFDKFLLFNHILFCCEAFFFHSFACLFSLFISYVYTLTLARMRHTSSRGENRLSRKN